MTRTRTRAAPLIATTAALAVTAVVWAPVSPAEAADPPFVGWSVILPPLALQYEPTSSDACVAGGVECVESTVEQMRTRFAPLAERCDHDAVFALAYLRTTEVYLESTRTEGFFDEPSMVNHEDVAFARMYFDAYDDWAADRVQQVPPAWRVAFRAADARRVSGTGNLLLGMSAHVNRDLPFVLAATGLVAPDGASRKADHDQINVMLNHVVQPLMAEAAARFDPQLAAVQTPYGVGYTGLMQMLIAWREAAWRQAERLVAAPTDAARDRVAQQIEASAAAAAQVIVTATSYVPPVTTARSRDNYCAVHGNP